MFNEFRLPINLIIFNNYLNIGADFVCQIYKVAWSGV